MANQLRLNGSSQISSWTVRWRSGWNLTHSCLKFKIRQSSCRFGIQRGKRISVPLLKSSTATLTLLFSAIQSTHSKPSTTQSFGSTKFKPSAVHRFLCSSRVRKQISSSAAQSHLSRHNCLRNRTRFTTSWRFQPLTALASRSCLWTWQNTYLLKTVKK